MCPSTVEIEGKRHYEVGEEDYVSVTTAINEVLKPFAGVPAFVLKEHGEIGDMVHSRIVELCKAKVLKDWWDYDQRVRNSVVAYESFRKTVYLHPIHVEVEIVNHEYKYAGRLDQYSRIPSMGNGILDWKSGQLLPEAFFQLAAYYKGLQVTHPNLKIDFGCAVHLDKHTGQPHPYFLEPSQLEYFFEGFVGILSVYRQLQELNLIIKSGDRWKMNH